MIRLHKYIIYCMLTVIIVWTNGSKYNQTSRNEYMRIMCADEHSIDLSGQHLSVLWYHSCECSSYDIESSPLCLDADKYLITRDCVHSTWIPYTTPDCEYSQISYRDSNKCPKNFEPLPGFSSDVNLLCVRLTDAQSWDNNICASVGSTTTLFDLNRDQQEHILEYIAAHKAVWLPAKSIYDKIHWKLPSKLHTFVTIENMSDDDGCLLMNISDSSLSIEPCNSSFPMLCIYAESSPLLSLACPSGSYAARFNPMLCYWFDKNCSQLFQMNSVEANFIYQHLVKTNSQQGQCLFTVNTVEQRIFKSNWPEISQNVNYVNWMASPPLNSDNASILVADQYGRWFFDTYFTCAACQASISMSVPKINLSYNVNRYLELVMENDEYIWREGNDIGITCFTLNSKLLNLSVVNINEKTPEAEAQFPVNHDGYYWCVAYAIPTFQLIETEQLYIPGSRFIASVLFHCENCMLNMINGSFENSLKLKFHHMQSAEINEIKIISMEVISETTKYISRVRFYCTIISDERHMIEKNNLNIKDAHQLRAYHQRQLLAKALRNHPFFMASINSTEYCLPNSISILSAVNWLIARTGDIQSSVEFCLVESGLPALRQCHGNANNGVVWIHLTTVNCQENNDSSALQIFQWNEHYESDSETCNLLGNITILIRSSETILPAVIFYVSKIMEKVVKFKETSKLSKCEFEHIFDLYDSLMILPVHVMHLVSISNATNTLLASLDTLVNAYEPTDYDPETGIKTVLKSNLMTFIIDSGVQNLTGVALSMKPDEHNNSIRFLSKLQACQELLEDDTLEIGSYIPESLFQVLIKSKQHQQSRMRIIITIFNNDRLFQVPYEQDEKVCSKILSISVPDFDTSMLPEPLPLFFHLDGYRRDHLCGFWECHIVSGWSMNGLSFVRNIKYIFQYNSTHLTHFAYLIHGKINLSGSDELSLNLITIIGCSLSLIGILGICTTAILFSKWRSKSSSKLLLQLCIAIAAQMILLCFIDTEQNTTDLLEKKEYLTCIVVGAFLHYLVLVVFVWMLIIAYLQFMRYVVVFSSRLRTEHFLLKFSFFSWGAPTIPVIIILSVDAKLYLPAISDDDSQICYPTGYALYLGLILPISIVIVANLIIFIIVIYNLLRSPKTVIRATERHATVAQLRLSIFLFFLLGLTWMFAFFSSKSGIGLMFSYLFCITATLQGLILFVYFIILDPSARCLWSTFFHKYMCKTNEAKITDDGT